MHIMDKLKEKLKNSTLTRAELNAAQPSDESTIEWKAWNNLRIAMNDMLWEDVQAIKSDLKVRRAKVDERFDEINETLKEIRDIVLNTRDNHLHEVKEILDEVKMMIETNGKS